MQFTLLQQFWIITMVAWAVLWLAAWYYATNVLHEKETEF